MRPSFIALFLALFCGLAAAQAPRPPLPQAGGRVEIPDTDFSIVPPNGWEVLRNSHGSSLVFKAPKQTGEVRYQATIQVMTFQGYRYIDDLTQQEYGRLIVDKFSTLSNQVHNYRLRSEEKVKLENGDPAILYYTEFAYDDIPIMQMHILVSSATHHFLMTYTDLAQAFESESSPALGIAYGSMQSALISSKPPSRFQAAIIGSIAALCLIVFWFASRIFRSRRMARLGARLEAEDSVEVQKDEEVEYYSRQQAHSEHDEISRSSRKEAKAAKRPSNRHPEPDSDDEADGKEESSIAHSEVHSFQKPMRSESGRPMTQSGVWNIGDEAQDISRPASSIKASIMPPPPQSSAPRPMAHRPAPPDVPSAVPHSLPPASLPAQKVPQAQPREELALRSAPAKSLSPRTDEQALPQKSRERTVPPKKAPELSDHGRRSAPPQALAEDLSEEARLSQILPRAGSVEEKKTKKRGRFWKKEAVEASDDEPMTDTWEVDAKSHGKIYESSPKGKGKSKEIESPETVSHVWALDAGEVGADDPAVVTATSAVWALDGQEAAPVSAPPVKASRSQLKKQKKGKQAEAAPEETEEEGNWNLARKRAEDDDEEDVG